MYQQQQFSERLSHLRLEKNISAREMSLSLGQNVSYINRIENGKSLPSLQAFFDICEYFKITPMDFFNENQNNFTYQDELNAEMKKLSPEMSCHVLAIIKRLNRTK